MQNKGSVDNNGDIRSMNRPKGFGISLVLANCLQCFLVVRCLTADFQSFMNPTILMSAQCLRSKQLKGGTAIAYGSRVLLCLFVLCPFGSVMKRKEDACSFFARLDL